MVYFRGQREITSQVRNGSAEMETIARNTDQISGAVNKRFPLSFYAAKYEAFSDLLLKNDIHH
jgi:hypothetical protein